MMRLLKFSMNVINGPVKLIELRIAPLIKDAKQLNR